MIKLHAHLALYMHEFKLVRAHCMIIRYQVVYELRF